MKLKKASSVDYVHQFSDIAFMKFKPKKVNLKIQQQKHQEQNPFMSRIKSFISWRAPQSTSNSRASQKSALQKSSSQVSIKSISLNCQQPGSTIIFLEKITAQHFIIGNQNQIDLVFIGGIVGNFIDTQSLWQLNIGRPIINLAIDPKKCHIAIQTNTQIVIYHYDNKKINTPPSFLTGIKTKCEGKYIRFMRDSVLTVFYQNFIEAYIIEQNKMRRKMCKQIKQAADKQLFQVPNCVQNSLNIFYIKKSATLKTFQLWYLQLTLRGYEVEMTQLMKVYDIKQGLQKKIKLQNFSRQIFLMNLGFQILAVKKGYIIDSAYLNIQSESTFLHYIGNNRLLHLSPQKAQIYRFNINFTTNPPRIDIQSLDSIEVKKPQEYQYIGALEMFDRNFAVFYQIVPNNNRRTQGQITYCFAITRHVTIQQKIKQIFNFGFQPLKDVSLQLIEERVDMARKIGLNRTQIYLELWNRTNKTQVEQFKFLLDTLSYETIKLQIEKKMKKSSMLYRQVYKIEQSCFDMIKQNLFSSRCTQQVVRQYLTSHFLLRKLEFYRDVSIAQKKRQKQKKQLHGQQQKDDALKINIQDYNIYSKADIKTLFLQLVHQYCIDGKDVLLNIRLFLKSFRFIFRIIYKELLQDIIKTTKSSLIKLIQNFPQILPYKHILSQNGDPSLYQGVWEQISKLQEQRNLYIQSISTIDNKQVIAQMTKSLWFRRNFMTLHDMTSKSRQQIIKINRSNNSDQIFYFFISKVFQYVKQQESLNKIISFLERNYQKMPVHIHQKIFLYRKIFVYFRQNNVNKYNEKLTNFHDVLEMKDYQLFKAFFDYQKINKGCLLKAIKQIYEQVGGNDDVPVSTIQLLDEDGQDYELKRNRVLPRGTAWFNQGMLSYFSSQLSEISDLKYILNRINNAKIQFFSQNDHLVYVLVKAFELKVKVGSQNDVPIDEIMVYFENIPLSYNSPVLIQLQKIQKINQEIQRFQEIQINMTISQIIKNCQNVINALVDQQIKKRHVMQVQDMQQMRNVSYDILAQIQVVKQKIYTMQYSDLTFFVYITKIMTQVHMIKYAHELLNDPYLKQHYSIKDLKVVQDIILYMYKLKLSSNPKYIDNEQYLTQLLQILPEDNPCKIYIHCQIQYAKILSAPGNPVQYPITDKIDGITIVQLQQRIHQLSGDFLLNIDIEQLHQLMNTMQKICYQDTQATLYTSINQIYQIIILKLIQQNKIIESLPLVKKLLLLTNNQYQVIFPLFYIDLISKQLTVQCKKLLLKAVSYLFNQPLELLRIIQELIGRVFSNQQRDQYFKNLAQKSTEYRKNYNPKNAILDQQFLSAIRNQQMQNNFKNMVDQSGHHLIKTKQDFNAFQFSLLFIMLTQQPYALGKYIFCRRYEINYKTMRSFLSYVIKEQIFSSIRVLQFGRRLFNIILQSSTSFLPYQSIASQYSSMPMDQTIQFEQLYPPEPISLNDDQFVKKAKMLQSKIQKCIIAFDTKKTSVLQKLKITGLQQKIQQKRKRIQDKLLKPVDLSEKAPSQYPFVDSDDDYGQQQKFDQITKSIRRKKAHGEFNPSVQRTKLMNRTTKNYALFMSNEGEKDQHMWLTSKGPASKIRKLKNARSFAVDGGNSLKMSFDQDGLFQSFKPQSNRSNRHNSQRISQQGGLAQSLNSYEIGMSSSALASHHHQRRSANLDRVTMSPQISANQEQSIQMDQGQIQTYKINSGQYLQEDKYRNEIKVQQQNYQTGQQAFKVRIQQIDQNAYLSLQKMKKQIIQSVSEQGQQFYVDLSQLNLQEQKNPQQFINYLIQLLKCIYNDQSIKSKTRLRLVKQIQSYYPDISISKQYLQIYIRFESYHSKYDIAIPIHQMFPLQFLFTKSKDFKQLFNLVAEKIVLLVDQSNIYKISKIIHLAFKASSYEQQFFFSYLCMAVLKFDLSNQSQNEINMQMEKLNALIQKLPIHIILQRGHKLIQNMQDKARKQQIITSMLNYLRKKKSIEEVDKFQQSLKKY